ncbi:NACHT domain-containing protein [Nonomuraea sp. NPDC050663]|uniref:NACHT domain-containing protein n=1 Tax=Nonomuraea sp. NPDC050663 TaxID=3364370 RepID=UPI0037A51E17
MDSSQLLPYGGALLGLFLLLWVLDKFTGGIVEELGKRSLDRLVRRPRQGGLFGRRALRSYAAAVRHAFGTHTMGFRKDDAPVTVEEVYVPVRYESEGRGAELEQLLATRTRTIVVGEPGAGKSMLLKHLMLGWAREPRRDRRVPVLADLHQFGDLTLLDLLTRSLSGGRHPVTAEQVREALGGGRLRVYFDGLDEVGRDHQPALLAELRELARDHPDCPMVVTCRESVYQGELAAEFGAPVKVVELDDAALRVLLRHLVGAGERADRLRGALHANHAVLELARSPMLLTMISYLFLEGVFGERAERLPRSRSEFYELAVSYLLRRDAARGLGGATRFDAPVKLAVLRRLALHLMSSGDGRTIGHRDLLALVRAEAGDFNLDPGQAGALVDEIVDRSRLLIRLASDEGVYAFRHLSLQEYLAAVELSKGGQELARRYRAAPAAWHEVVRIWCAVTSDDCTWLLRDLYADAGSHVLVLRCLAEATRVESAFADVAIDAFLVEVRLRAPLPDPAVKALGALAAIDTPRGNRAFTELLSLTSDDPGNQTAYLALAASGRPGALSAIVAAAQDSAAAREALSSMGDLAVPELRRVGTDWAIDELGWIGTPAAAEALARLVTESRSVRAAWWLAARLNRDDVRAGFNAHRDPAPTSALSEPYRDDWSPRLRAVFEEVVQALGGAAAPGARPEGLPPIFPPVALAVVALDRSPGIGTVSQAPLTDQTKRAALMVLSQVRTKPPLSGRDEMQMALVALAEVTERHGEDQDVADAVQRLSTQLVLRMTMLPATRTVLRSVEWPTQAAILGRFPKGWGLDQWRLLADERPEPKALRWAYLASVVVLSLVIAGMGGYGLLSAMIGSRPLGPAFLPALTLVGTLVFIVGVFAVKTNLGFVLFLIGALGGAVGWFWFAVLTMTGSLGYNAGGGLMAVLTVLPFVLRSIYAHRRRRWANPFREVLAQCAPRLLPRGSRAR